MKVKIKGNIDKEKFRSTKVWVEFSKALRNWIGCVCERCGTKTKRLSVHHAFPEDYKNLDPRKFFCLCSACHKEVGRAERLKHREKYNQKWIKELEVYIMNYNLEYKAVKTWHNGKNWFYLYEMKQKKYCVIVYENDEETVLSEYTQFFFDLASATSYFNSIKKNRLTKD